MAVKYLDLEGLSQYDSKIKEYIGKTIVSLEDNGTTTTGTWLAKSNQVASLIDGTLFIYKVVVAGASTTTLKINSLTAKTIYRVGTTKLTTQYGVGQYILLIYNSTNDCFRVLNDSDANSYAYVRQYQMGNNEAGTTNLYPILTRYNLTNKNASYDTAYSRFHTETYINMTNGYLYAPKLYSGGTEVSVVGHTHSQYLTGITSSDVTNALGFTPYNATNPNGYTSVTESTVSGWGFTKNAGTITGIQLNGSTIASSGVANIKALPNYSIKITHNTSGQPLHVKFLSVNYSNNGQYEGVYIKLGVMSCHPDGYGYQYMEDIIIGVRPNTDTISCQIYKYIQSQISSQVEGVTRYFGDVYYVLDTTNKVVDFYICAGQYTSSDFTPYTVIGSTSTKGITQYSGTATYYSSGTRVWATGCGTTYARESDIPTKTSQLTNDSGYITSSSLSNYVTTNTQQAITGQKTIKNHLYLTDNDALMLSSIYGNGAYLDFNNNYAGFRFIGGESFIVGSSSSKMTLNINGSTGTSGQLLTVNSSGYPIWTTRSHLYRPIQVNGTQILANSSSSALNLVAGTGITLSNSSGSVTISSSGGGSANGYQYETLTANGTAKHFSTEGSGKVIITSIENDMLSGWFFRLICNQSLIIENVLYVELVLVNNSPIALNFVDTSGTWGSLSYDANWDTFDTWLIDSPMGAGDVSVNYIGDFA